MVNATHYRSHRESDSNLYREYHPVDELQEQTLLKVSNLSLGLLGELIGHEI